MLKNKRNYSLTIDDQNLVPVTIEPPFTIEFDVFRNYNASANVAKIRIYNLASLTRNRLLKNPLVGDPRRVSLKAGYGNELSTILDGFIKNCWSVREGTNFITDIEAFDAGYAYTDAHYENQFPSGTTYQTIIEDMIKSLKQFGVERGGVGDFSFLGKLEKGSSFNGPTVDLLFSTTQGRFFIDNNRAFAISPKEAIPSSIDTIDSSFGLLGTPIRNQTYLNFDILFEPRLVMQQNIKLTTTTGYEKYNGNYKVISIKHRGMISESVSGQAITSLGCLGNDPQTIQSVGGF